jgi:hypothetical protein
MASKKKTKKKKKFSNPVYDAAKRHQENPNNKAPSAQYIQGIRRRELMIKKLLGK